ncbi:MAG: hypothetical protein H7318_04555 [Oligoflexus sp.]|nr:hypothetical protein [Oligoflexus sp.]
MRTPFKDKQRGTSLVELMIASTLLALIGVAASNFFKRITAADVEARARAGTLSEITLFLSTIERDFKLRPGPASGAPPIAPICALPLCTSFNISRMVRYNSSAGALAGKVTTMAINYRNLCVPVPAVMEDKFSHQLSIAENNTVNSDTNYSGSSDGDRSNALNGRCFKKSACPAGQYAQLQITTNPTGPILMPSYPRFDPSSKTVKFPDLTNVKSASIGVIGAVLCGDSAGTLMSDRLVLEAAYVNSSGQMRIEKSEVSIPRNNVANIQMLPNIDTLAP